MKNSQDQFQSPIRLEGADRPFEPDELPKTLFPTKRVSITQYNPVEADILASNGQKLVKFPEGKKPHIAHLAQYAGRSPAGNARSIANLVRPVAQTKETTRIATMPAAAKKLVEVVVPKMPALKTVTGRSLRSVMSSDEWNLYVETWQKWMGAHATDYTEPEDEQDVHTICMETIKQFRLNLVSFNNPKSDYSVQYQASFNRMDIARKNLTARRVDRVGTKAGQQKTIINVAVVAGQVSQEQIELRRQQTIQNDAEMMQFLEGTVVESTTVDPEEKAKEA